MIEYEINDDLNISSDRNLNEMQFKSKNDINIQLTKNSKNRFSTPNRKSFLRNSELYKIPNIKIDHNINKIVLGKILKNTVSLNLRTTSRDSKDKKKLMNSNNNSISNKNSISIGYSVNLNDKNSNLTSKEHKFYSKDSHFNKNLNLCNNYKNLNTISNIESEGGFFTTKNKYSFNTKNFGNSNQADNTNNSNNLKSINVRKSNEFDKTKTITNNKTDYKTLNSNNGNSKNGTLNSGANTNSQYSKFEVRLLDHFNHLKNQKGSSGNNLNNKENTIRKFKSNLNSKHKENDINIVNHINNKVKNASAKKDNFLNSENHNFNIYVNNSNTKLLKNNNISNNNSNIPNNQLNNKKNSFMNLKLNLEAENNFIANNNDNSNSIDVRFPTTTINDEKIKYLLSDQFKVSLDNSVKNNKSFQSNISKNNKYQVRKSLISFDLAKENSNQRSVSIGERLYRKSIALKEMKEKRASIELYKKDMETINNCSFIPKICEDSIMLNIKVNQFLFLIIF